MHRSSAGSDHTRDQGAYAGEALVGTLHGKMLLGSECCHRSSVAAGEKRPHHLGALGPDSAREVHGRNPGGEGYLEAPPDIPDIGVPGPDSRRETFSTRALSSSANGRSHRSVWPLSRCSSRAIVTGWRASANCRPGTSVVNRSSATRTFSRARLVYAGTRTSISAAGFGEPPPANHPGRDIGYLTRQPVTGHLDVVSVPEPPDDTFLAGHDRRNAEIHVSGLAVKIHTELPPGGEHGDHVTADDPVFSRDVCERSSHSRSKP